MANVTTKVECNIFKNGFTLLKDQSDNICLRNKTGEKLKIKGKTCDWAIKYCKPCDEPVVLENKGNSIGNPAVMLVGNPSSEFEKVIVLLPLLCRKSAFSKKIRVDDPCMFCSDLIAEGNLVYYNEQEINSSLSVEFEDIIDVPHIAHPSDGSISDSSTSAPPPAKKVKSKVKKSKELKIVKIDVSEDEDEILISSNEEFIEYCESKRIAENVDISVQQLDTVCDDLNRRVRPLNQKYCETLTDKLKLKMYMNNINVLSVQVSPSRNGSVWSPETRNNYRYALITGNHRVHAIKSFGNETDITHMRVNIYAGLSDADFKRYGLILQTATENMANMRMSDKYIMYRQDYLRIRDQITYISKSGVRKFHTSKKQQLEDAYYDLFRSVDHEYLPFIADTSDLVFTKIMDVMNKFDNGCLLGQKTTSDGLATKPFSISIFGPLRTKAKPKHMVEVSDDQMVQWMNLVLQKKMSIDYLKTTISRCVVSGKKIADAASAAEMSTTDYGNLPETKIKLAKLKEMKSDETISVNLKQKIERGLFSSSLVVSDRKFMTDVTEVSDDGTPSIIIVGPLPEASSFDAIKSTMFSKKVSSHTMILIGNYDIAKLVSLQISCKALGATLEEPMFVCKNKKVESKGIVQSSFQYFILIAHFISSAHYLPRQRLSINPGDEVPQTQKSLRVISELVKLEDVLVNTDDVGFMNSLCQIGIRITHVLCNSGSVMQLRSLLVQMDKAKATAAIEAAKQQQSGISGGIDLVDDVGIISKELPRKILEDENSPLKESVVVKTRTSRQPISVAAALLHEIGQKGVISYLVPPYLEYVINVHCS